MLCRQTCNTTALIAAYKANPPNGGSNSVPLGLCARCYPMRHGPPLHHLVMLLDSPNLYLSSFSFSPIVQGTTVKELLKVFTNVDIRRCIFENCPKNTSGVST